MNVRASHIKQKLIINPAKTRIYSGCPGFNANENSEEIQMIHFVQTMLIKKLGITRKVLAKIAGITPAMFTLKGR